MTAVCISIIVAADEYHVQYRWQNCKNDKNTGSDVEYRSFNTITGKKLLKRKFSECKDRK